MRVATLLMLLTAALLAVALTRPPASPAAPPTESLAPSCTIAGLPQGEVPTLTFSPAAELRPEQMPKLETAYFSMGCFWGSEGMLASCPGVLFTRVGFTGGTLSNPSYSAIGDHVETVEVLFDPDQISYESLLEHFWTHHNARAKPIFRQYASAIFCASPEQERRAKLAREKRQGSQEEPLLTAIKRLERFYPAEPRHQKYYLSQDPDLLAKLPRYGEQRLETRLATKLNALAGRTGNRDDIKAAIQELGVTPEVIEALLIRAEWPAAPPGEEALPEPAHGIRPR